jgi:hypothetical protein
MGIIFSVYIIGFLVCLIKNTLRIFGFKDFFFDHIKIKIRMNKATTALNRPRTIIIIISLLWFIFEPLNLFFRLSKTK